MNKYTLGIDGMRCGMCEVHVQDVIRKHYKCKKIKASHISKKVVIITEEEIELADFQHTFQTTGYRVLSYNKEEAIRKFFSWR